MMMQQVVLLILALQKICSGIVLPEKPLVLTSEDMKNIINVTRFQNLRQFTNEIMVQQLLLSEGETFIISPDPLEKSLATISTLATNDSRATQRKISQFLGCPTTQDNDDSSSGGGDCSSLLRAGNLDNFGFWTNAKLDRIRGFHQSHLLTPLLENMTNCRGCHTKFSKMNENLEEKKEMFIINAENYEFGRISKSPTDQFIPHAFGCMTSFSILVTNAKMKVVPNLNMQLIEIELEENELQIMMPIESTSLHNLMINFENLEFNVFDALNSVEYVPMTIIFPLISLNLKVELGKTLFNSGLEEIFAQENHVFPFQIKNLIQFNSFSIYPESNPKHFKSTNSKAILINRPFIFRLLSNNYPKFIGLITCPTNKENLPRQCQSFKQSCLKHGFCSRLDDICQIWTKCNQ